MLPCALNLDCHLLSLVSTSALIRYLVYWGRDSSHLPFLYNIDYYMNLLYE